MTPLRTIYRLVVMAAAGVIVIKGWQLCGPTTDQVKAFAVDAIELAAAAWDRTKSPAMPPDALADDPRPPAISLNADGVSVPSVVAPPIIRASETVAAPAVNAPFPAAPERLPELLAHLQEIGGANPQLGAWGSSGELYRFSCRAQLPDSPLFVRHFEAVANEPLAAVEQVVANVEAWRAERQHDLAP